ncbi:hypothetical protein PBCV1_a491aL [Paramecium bursaria Chlorella virus 1]|uniref:Uncharacterized protein n=1 Tax=Paramecium bursaria Chlorella virus 1 TaxID=10506 RepID=F8TU47_PBCV1|nr:hypothetical protein PBCV1_a491aL [Paramecium bursaria Chlorella virus 1]AEI70108.1 hypothetical protein [Paramecium bursaria Chlorella virus 1]
MQKDFVIYTYACQTVVNITLITGKTRKSSFKSRQGLPRGKVLLEHHLVC